MKAIFLKQHFVHMCIDLLANTKTLFKSFFQKPVEFSILKICTAILSYWEILAARPLAKFICTLHCSIAKNNLLSYNVDAATFASCLERSGVPISTPLAYLNMAFKI